MLKKVIVFPLIAILLSLSLSSCGLDTGPDKFTKQKMRSITLRYWRVFDGEDDFRAIIDKYSAKHPNIKIEYKKLRYDEYEKELIEAFAADRGPDIFSIHNTWTRKYQTMGLLEPIPETITMIYPKAVGSIKKEIQYDKSTRKTISLKELKNYFIDTVYNDSVISVKNEETNIFEDKIIGLPLGLDTMVLYYNKDLFNNAGIANPPEFWNRKFQQDVKKLTKQNNKGEIIQAGVALGGTENIERATDILAVLMMQNGTEMMDDGSVKFNLAPDEYKAKSYNPGREALRFYTDFANPAKEVYSWNENLSNSFDLFVQGKLAMMFGYSYMLPMIKARTPGMNFSVAKLPQIEGNTEKVNFANYWIEVVSKKSKATEEAWDFLTFLSGKDQVESYLQKTKKPTVLRSLIEEQLEDDEIKMFAEQILTAKSWYLGVDSSAMEGIMKEMIEQAIIGQKDLQSILNLAAKKVQQTIK